MKPGYSIRARLLLGAALVLLAFLAAAGFAVQRAHADSVRDVHYGRLQGTVYLLLARAEIDEAGRLEMPREFAEPRLSLPGSGLYAAITNVRRNEEWRSSSSVGQSPPFRTRQPVGQWSFGDVERGKEGFLAATFAVNWAGPGGRTPLVLSVLEDRAAFDREIATFTRTLWLWLGGAALLLLAAQTMLLHWGLLPLKRVAGEIRRVESGDQDGIEGSYPAELSGLTDNLNTLIQQERTRQTRYKEALSFLAHSLKTPLAVLRNTLGEPDQLPRVVAQQVDRMDDIVQHQLGRAAASGSARFTRPVPVAPVLERIREALGKVYADKGVAIELDAARGLAWRIAEADLFEMMGNLMDNAAKWSKSRVVVRAWREGAALRLRIDDDGPGFSDTESILRLHVRLDERVPGHGVGLAVVNDLVASYHGDMKLERSDLGGGRVDITLPGR
ncbi:MAG: periplasmic sensor signal transduction histidine kinase [Ramlibacter sp.]|jgi:two-component system sensor histidine kinase PhoQ|nr:periplasmic sensor signal transduction histidine kinase [Ramlibacter sp.]MCE3272582.1 periplasmic sensor signal transduction histidine kinase [Ramlibacter sp.]